MVLAALPLAALGAGAASPVLLAGAARVSITPDPSKMPYTLGGYFAANRLDNRATGVHDTCCARAVVFERGTVRCALVSIELCFLPGSLRDAVLARIGDLGIPADAVFLSATHTHSATEPLCLHSGMVGAAGKLPQFDPKLEAWFADHIAQAIRDAEQHLRPARIGCGQVEHVGLNRNRRGEKLTDDTLTGIRVDGVAGSPIASVFLYAAHPTLYGADNLEVSGDWPGELQRDMERSLPGSVSLFVNGSEGDAAANIADSGTEAERVVRYGDEVAAKALALWKTISPSAVSPTIGAWSETAVMPERTPHPGFLFAAAMIGATQRETREMVRKIMPADASVYFLRLGDALLIGFPGEPTAEIGLAAKEAAVRDGVRFPAVAALTNGWLGYLISPSQYRAGNYEATMSFYGASGGETLLACARKGLVRLASNSR